MSQTIYKYPVTPSSGPFALDMPIGAKLLDVQFQEDASGPGGKMWALVEQGKPVERRNFQIYGTGHKIPDEQQLLYVGTYQQFSGELVWHLFEVLN